LLAHQVNLHCGGAMSLIEDLNPDSFDIIFVDPPFDSNLGGLVLERLDKNGCIRRGGFVYIESPLSLKIPTPEGWSMWREKELGEVRMQLFRRFRLEDERNTDDDGSDY